jgi:hypothetical protein
MSNAVDIYDMASGNWSKEVLSIARDSLAAASVGNLAIFAGGGTAGGVASSAVDIYNVSSKSWLPSFQLQGGARLGLAATSVGNLAIFAGGGGLLPFF